MFSACLSANSSPFSHRPSSVSHQSSSPDVLSSNYVPLSAPAPSRPYSQVPRRRSLRSLRPPSMPLHDTPNAKRILSFASSAAEGAKNASIQPPRVGSFESPTSIESSRDEEREGTGRAKSFAISRMSGEYEAGHGPGNEIRRRQKSAGHVTRDVVEVDVVGSRVSVMIEEVDQSESFEVSLARNGEPLQCPSGESTGSMGSLVPRSMYGGSRLKGKEAGDTRGARKSLTLFWRRASAAKESRHGGTEEMFGNKVSGSKVKYRYPGWRRETVRNVGKEVRDFLRMLRGKKKEEDD